MRQATDLTRINGAVDVQHIFGWHAHGFRYRDALIRAVARMTAAEMIGHPPPDQVKLDPAADAVAVRGGLGLLEGQHFRL